MKQFIAMVVAIIVSFFRKLFGRDDNTVLERTERTTRAEAALVEAKIRLDAAEAFLSKTRHNAKAKAFKAYRQALAALHKAEMEVLGCEGNYDASISALTAAESAAEKAVKVYKAAHERLELLRKELFEKSVRAAAAQRNHKGRKTLDEEAAAKYVATLAELDAAKVALAHATKVRGMWQGHATRRHDPVSVTATENWRKAEQLAKANICRLETKIANLEGVALKTLSMNESMSDLSDEIFAIEAEISIAETEQAVAFNAMISANEAVNVAKKIAEEAAKALRTAIRNEKAARRELKRHEAWEASTTDDVKRAAVAFRKAQKAYAEAQEAVRQAAIEDEAEKKAIASTATVAQTGAALVDNTTKRVAAVKAAEAKLRAARIRLANNDGSIMLQKLVARRERELEKAQDSLRRCNELYARLATYGEAVRIVITTDEGNSDTLWAKSEEAAATAIAKYLDSEKSANFAKVRLIHGGEYEIVFFERTGANWIRNASPKAKTRFATAVVKYVGNSGYNAGMVDRTGKGNMPEWLVVLKFGRMIVRTQTFGSEIGAKNAFGDLNAACRYTAFRAQLFHYMELIRETGDHIDRQDAVADDLAQIVMARFEAAGIPANRVAAIMDNMYDGSIRSLRWICTMSADEFQEIDGIGERTAKLAEEALADFVLPHRASERIELSKSPMIPVRKYILNKDGSITETIVHVKTSPLFRKVQELAAEKAAKAHMDVPAMLPLIVFEHQVKLGKKEEPEDCPAIEELRKKVREGWAMEDGLFRPAMHGTNAGKLCRTWWIREDLVDEAIRFCSVEASSQAMWTAAKRNAYLGLMGVGTTPIDLPIGAEHIAFIPNLTVEVKDNVVFVAGKAVGTVEELPVLQKAFDGFMMGHISEKLKKEFLKNRNRAERTRIRKAIAEFHKHGSTIRFPGVKGLCDTSIDWHAQFHAWGIDKVVDMFGRELDIDDLAIIADAGVFKFSIGENGTHSTYEEYVEKCHKLGHSIGRLVMETKAHVSWLPTQQLQTLAGVPEFVVRRLSEVAANYMANLRTAEGVTELLPGIEGELVKACPQIASHWYFSERLQEAYQKNEWLVYAGKIPGVSTGHFVAPDPFAFMAWAAFRDLEKVKEHSELGKFEVRCADTAGKCDGIGTAIMSRNPSTDLGGQVEVTVFTEFSSEAEKFVLRKSSIVYTSVWDTSATRLRMDFDGDHVNLCWLQGVIDGVRIAAQLWYGMDRAPVIDWVPPEGKKSTLSDEDLLAYFEGLWSGSELGLRMDTLTKIYNSIPCGGEIQDWHREAVAWLTYAVNVLVDASKHGGEKIEEPEAVRKAEDLLMAKAIAFGKVKAGKTVDMRKVYARLGNGIIDTYAKLAKIGIQSKFEMDGCDYSKVFDPRCILGDKNTGEEPNVQMQRIAIYNLCADSRWSYYAYLRDADGHLTTELSCEPTPVAAYFGSIKEAADNRNIGVGSIVGIRDVELGTNQVGFLSYNDEEGTFFLDEIPGKWIIRERWEVTTREGDTVANYSGLLGILQGRYADAEKAMREGEHAEADYLAARRWTAYATRESMAAYAALYGYEEEDAMEKVFLWLFGGKQHSRWDTDLFLRAYAKEIGIRLGVSSDVAMTFDPDNLVEDDRCSVVTDFDDSGLFSDLID